MAEKVRTLRVDRDLSQQELGDLVEISRQSIVDIESGKKVPRAKTLKKILMVLGVEVETVEFNEQTENWLLMFGTLIEAIAEPNRASAVSRALGTLAAEVGASNVTHAQFGRNVSGANDTESLNPIDRLDDAGKVEYEGLLRVAASEGELAVDSQAAVGEEFEPAPEDD